MHNADYVAIQRIVSESIHRNTQTCLTRLWRFACVERMLPVKIGKGLYFRAEDARRLVQLLNAYALAHPRNLKHSAMNT